MKVGGGEGEATKQHCRRLAGGGGDEAGGGKPPTPEEERKYGGLGEALNM